MTYKEIKSRLSKCESTLQAIKDGTYNSAPKEKITATKAKLEILKESLYKKLQEADGKTYLVTPKSGQTSAVSMSDKEVEALKDADDVDSIKGVDGQEVKENEGLKFSIQETKAIAKVVGKAVAKALKSLGDELAHMKATDIEESSFEIYVEYKNNSDDQFSFYISDDRLHLVDFSFDKELVDVGVKPSGEPVVNVDVLSNELVKHFKGNMNEMKPGSEEAMEHERFKSLSKKDQEAIEKIRALMAAEKEAQNEDAEEAPEGGIDQGGDLDVGHQDDEPNMLKKDIYDIAVYAAKLYKQLDKYDKGDGEVDFPHWWQGKVIKAREFISSAQHYLEAEEKQPVIDQLALEESEGPSKSDMKKEKGIASQHKSALDAQEKKKAIARFIANMMKKGIVSKDKKILDKDAYRREFDAYKKTLNERVGSLDEFINLLKDRSENNDTPIEEEALEVIEALADHFGIKIQIGGFVGEKVLKEYTDKTFSGAELINMVSKESPDMFGKQVIADLLPKGVASEDEAVKALHAHDKSGIKQRMSSQYAPMFVHVQYHELEHEGETYRLHQRQYYNSNFKDKDPDFNPAVSKITLIKVNDPDRYTKNTENLGSILVKTDAYVQDLKNIPGLGQRHMEESIKEDGFKVKVNGKEVDISSIEIAGVDRSQGYDDGTVDAYAEYATFIDGTELSDNELDDLTDNNPDLIHDLALDTWHENINEAKKCNCCGDAPCSCDSNCPECGGKGLYEEKATYCGRCKTTHKKSSGCPKK